tara:strand:+ start:2703 stop:3017 length:315 start_codon:yes stop_codon:yes gene_type:complete
MSVYDKHLEMVTLQEVKDHFNGSVKTNHHYAIISKGNRFLHKEINQNGIALNVNGENLSQRDWLFKENCLWFSVEKIDYLYCFKVLPEIDLSKHKKLLKLYKGV